MSDSSKKYYAFISYRHADNVESGRQWATWLHQAIETYQVPDELVGKTNDRGDIIPPRIFPVFRDEEALPADADLSNVITKALDNSRFLIVLCSPRARQSSFVEDEIRYFKQLGRSDRIIAAIIDGEPNVALDQHKVVEGFSVEQECFPEPLQYVYDATGQQTSERAEPVAADFRVALQGVKSQGWTTPEALRHFLEDQVDTSDKKLSEQAIDQLVKGYEKQLQLMLLKIIAGILGLPLDDLTQRDKAYQLEIERQKAKRLKQWIGALAALFLIALFTGIFAWQQMNIATEQKQQAQVNLTLTTVEKAKDLARQDRTKAILLLLNVLPGIYGGERPLVPEAIALLSNLNSLSNEIKLSDGENVSIEYSPDMSFIVVRDVNFYQSVIELKSSKTNDLINEIIIDGVFRDLFTHDSKKYITFSSKSPIVVWSTATGETEFEISKPNGFDPKVDIDIKDRYLLVSDYSYGPMLYSLVDGKLVHQFDDVGKITALKFSPDGNYFLAINARGEIYLASLEDRQLVKKLTINGDRFRADIVFSPDGRYALFELNKSTALVRIEDFKVVYSFEASVYSSKFTSDSKRLFLWSAGSKIYLLDLVSGKSEYTFEHNSRINSFNLSKDNSLLLTSSNDRTAKLWSAESGEPIRTLFHTQAVQDALFSKDNQSIITRSWKNMFYWDLELQQEQVIERAIQRLPSDRKCLTEQERRELFLPPLTEADKVRRGCQSVDLTVDEPVDETATDSKS